LPDPVPADPDPVASELDDALYYLRHHCVPCAERHFEAARAHGATPAQIAAIRARVGATVRPGAR
jgi:hypothetical protein